MSPTPAEFWLLSLVLCQQQTHKAQVSPQNRGLQCIRINPAAPAQGLAKNHTTSPSKRGFTSAQKNYEKGKKKISKINRHFSPRPWLNVLFLLYLSSEMSVRFKTSSVKSIAWRGRQLAKGNSKNSQVPLAYHHWAEKTRVNYLALWPETITSPGSVYTVWVSSCTDHVLREWGKQRSGLYTSQER